MPPVKPHISFWIISGLALIWNLMGCLNFVSQANPATVTQMPEVYQVIINGRPAWATAAFGVAVFGGAVGCLLLLMRRRVAVPVFILSFAGCVIIASFMTSIVGITPSMALSVLIAAALLWYASIVRRFGWLG